MILALVLGILWLGFMLFLMTPTSLWSGMFDRLTKAKYRADRVSLQIMLDHLRSFPDEWSVGRDQASFPKEGSKQIYLNYDDKRGWEYTLNSFGSKSRPLDGHFAKQFTSALTEENTRREKQALLRNFYPNLNGPLLLGSK